MECDAFTKKNNKCKNIAKFKASEHNFCHIHVPRSNIDCPICLLKLYDEIYLYCGHFFHKRCLEKWTKHNNSCPICRSVIFNNIDKIEYKNILEQYQGEELDIVRNVAIHSSSTDDLIEKLIGQGEFYF